MGKTVKTRTFSKLPKDQRARFTDYIRRNSTLRSSVLAEDLNLDSGTVAAVKANLTRRETT